MPSPTVLPRSASERRATPRGALAEHRERPGAARLHPRHGRARVVGARPTADAVEFDNVDAYANDTGLPISESAQLLFNTTLANLAHARGLTVALKNDLGQVGELVGYFDMAVNEQCE
jgi:hypothetical protein